MKRPVWIVALAIVAMAPACARSASAPTVPEGFTIEPIAHVDGPRELAVAANGDLFVGTEGDAIDVIPDAQSTPGKPAMFARVDDRPAAGIAIAGGTMFIGAQFGVYALPFTAGDRSARSAPRKIASVRPSGESRDHKTTSVAVSGDVLYASVGSSCNNCQPDLDATRATIEQMHLDGSAMTPRAVHFRNAIGLAVDPQSGALWAAAAGQDELEHGHPYEIVDDVSAHPGIADYGWPYCYEDHRAVSPARDCSRVAVPRVAVPAYETPIGAVFYPLAPTGRFAFPQAYRGALFLALHGSWHTPPVPPRVVVVPMRGDDPVTPVDWSNPNRQWREFVSGFQQPDGSRNGRPTGVAVGTDGSLFVADDDTGTIYRVRPKRG
jgi:glucose/arabinose dehydrogenase